MVTTDPDVQAALDLAKEKKEKDRKRATPKRRSGRKAAPPTKVEPGWFHHALAEGALRLFGVKASEALGGVDVELGTLPSDADDGEPEAIPFVSDTRAPEELLARVFAHVAHRVPGFKRVEKRLEGKELRSGPMSDLLALGIQLYRLNKPAIDAYLKSAVQTAVTNAQKQAQIKKRGPRVVPNNGHSTQPGPVPTTVEGR